MKCYFYPILSAALAGGCLGGDGHASPPVIPPPNPTPPPREVPMDPAPEGNDDDPLIPPPPPPHREGDPEPEPEPEEPPPDPCADAVTLSDDVVIELREPADLAALDGVAYVGEIHVVQWVGETIDAELPCLASAGSLRVQSSHALAGGTAFAAVRSLDFAGERAGEGGIVVIDSPALGSFAAIAPSLEHAPVAWIVYQPWERMDVTAGAVDVRVYDAPVLATIERPGDGAGSALSVVAAPQLATVDVAGEWETVRLVDLPALAELPAVRGVADLTIERTGIVAIDAAVSGGESTEGSSVKLVGNSALVTADVTADRIEVSDNAALAALTAHVTGWRLRVHGSPSLTDLEVTGDGIETIDLADLGSPGVPLWIAPLAASQRVTIQGVAGPAALAVDLVEGLELSIEDSPGIEAIELRGDAPAVVSLVSLPALVSLTAPEWGEATEAVYVVETPALDGCEHAWLADLVAPTVYIESGC